MVQVPLPRSSLSTQGTPRLSGQGVVPVEDTGGMQAQQLGGALTKAGSQFLAMQAQMNEDYALASSKSALNSFAEIADQTTQEFEDRVGKGAVDMQGEQGRPGESSKKVAQGLDEKMREIEQGLGTELAKRLFRDRADRGMIAYRGRLSRHEAQQIKVYNHGENVASLQRHKTGAIANYDATNPAASDADMADALSYAGELADDARLGPEKRTAFLLEQTTDIHAGRVETMLADKNAKGADAYLRGVGDGQIDKLTRGDLRRKIDGIQDAEKIEGLAVGVFNRQGYHTEQAYREALFANLPNSKRDEIEKTQAIRIGEEMGFTKKELDRNWRALLSDPDVVARMDDNLMTLDMEILKARYPGQTAATDPATGSYKRMLKTLRKMHKDGDIGAGELLQAERKIDEQVNRRTREVNQTANDNLQAVSQILQESQQTGEGPKSVHSPVFRTDYPDLYDDLERGGLLSQAAALSGKRVTNPDYYLKLYSDEASGALAKMDDATFKVTFQPHLDDTAWKEAVRMRAESRGTTGTIKDDPIVKWETSLKRHLGVRELLNATDRNTGIPKPNSTREQRYWLDLQHDLGRAITASGKEWTQDDVLKWVDEREADKPVFRDPNAWFFTETDPKRRADIEAEIRVADAAKDKDKADALRDQLKTKEVRSIGGEWVGVVDGVKAIGTQDDPIPPRASFAIRDRYRMDVLKERFGDTPRYRAIEKKVRAAGGFSPTGRRDTKMIEGEFLKEGLHATWPPVESQWQVYREIRGMYATPKERKFPSFSEPGDYFRGGK